MDLKLDINDCLIILGIIFLATGAWLIYLPAAFLIVGIILLTVGLLGIVRTR